jgi:hypothetical protein
LEARSRDQRCTGAAGHGADPGRGPYDQVLAVCTPGWIVALLLGVAVGAGISMWLAKKNPGPS